MKVERVKLSWKSLVYILVGVVLVVLTIVTGKKGLSQTDKDLYARAIELDETVKGLGFHEFTISEYKVRFFDGNADYVVRGNVIQKEEAVFETFVGTTVEVNGEFQVLLPTYDRFSQMFTALAAAGNMAEGNFSFEEADYSTNAHIATLWHEAFHTWQFTNQFSKIEAMAMEAGMTEDTSYSEIVLNEVDTNETLVLLFEQEMQLLHRILEEENTDVKKDLLEQVLLIQKERKTLLNMQATFVEQYYETIEGSAKYVEACIYKELEGEEAWMETYMAPFTYQNGSGKYYDIGMLKCLILDQIAPDWKEDFDVTVSMNVLLEQALKEM